MRIEPNKKYQMPAQQRSGLSVLPWVEVPAAGLSLGRLAQLAPPAWVAPLEEQTPEQAVPSDLVVWFQLVLILPCYVSVRAAHP